MFYNQSRPKQMEFSLDLSKKRVMRLLTMKVIGKPYELYRFVCDFKHQPQYQIVPQSEKYDNSNQEQLTFEARFHFQPIKRKEAEIKILAKNGKEISLTLLDCQVIPMGNGKTYIRGKYFDIFA